MKIKKGLGASARKTGRSRSTLVSPRKASEDTRSDRSRKRKVWMVRGEEGTLIVPCTNNDPDNSYKDLKEVMWYAALPTTVGESYTLTITLSTMRADELKKLGDCDGI